MEPAFEPASELRELRSYGLTGTVNFEASPARGATEIDGLY